MRLRCAQGLADAGQEMIGKNIAMVERTTGLLWRARHMANGMVEKLAAGPQRREGQPKIIFEAALRHMFGGANTPHPIETRWLNPGEKVYVRECCGRAP